MSVAGIVVNAQAFLLLPNCASIFCSSRPLRDCTAPRYLREAKHLGGLGSLYWQSWRQCNPKILSKFFAIILAAPTSVHTPQLLLPQICDNDSFLAFARTVIAYPKLAFVRELVIRKCMILTPDILPYLSQLTQLEVLDCAYTGIFRFANQEATIYERHQLYRRQRRQQQQQNRINGVQDDDDENNEQEDDEEEESSDQVPQTFAALSGMEWLRELYIDNCVLTSISGLGQLRRLHKLDITNNRIADFSALHTCTKLEQVIYCNFEWGHQQGPLDMSGLSRIASLDISQPSISTRWGRTVTPNAQQFAKLTELRHLKFDHAGDLVTAFSNWIEGVFPTLVCFECDNAAQCRDVGVFGGATSLRILRYTNSRYVTDADFEGLHGSRSLEVVDLHGCTLLKSVNIVGSFPNLRELDIAGCVAVDDDGIKALSAASELESIKLDGLIKVTTVAHLARLEMLRWLSCRDIPQLRGADSIGASILATRERLAYLDLIGTNVFRDDPFMSALLIKEERAAGAFLLKARREKAVVAESESTSSNGGNSTAAVPTQRDEDGNIKEAEEFDPFAFM